MNGSVTVQTFRTLLTWNGSWINATNTRFKAKLAEVTGSTWEHNVMHTIFTAMNWLKAWPLQQSDA